MTDTTDREIVVSRPIAAPPDRVFEAFTRVEHLSAWWGPAGFSTTTRAFDFSIGGVWQFTMHGPGGVDYPEWIRWEEISPPERIVLLHGEHEDDPNAFTTVLAFTAEEASTRVEMRTIFPTAAQRDEAAEQYHAAEAGASTLAGLDAYVSGGTRK